VGTLGEGSPPSVPSWARGSLRARSVRCCSVAQLRLAVGTSDGLGAGHDVVGHLARRRTEGGQDGDWWLCVAAVAYCEAADSFVNSQLRRGRSTRSSAQIPCNLPKRWTDEGLRRADGGPDRLEGCLRLCQCRCVADFVR